MKFFHLIMIISLRCKSLRVSESTRGSRRAENSGFVLGQACDLHTLTSDMYRLQTAAQSRAQWQLELTAVISYPPFIRRLFLAAYVSARVRACSVAESHAVLTERVLTHTGARRPRYLLIRAILIFHRNAALESR